MGFILAKLSKVKKLCVSLSKRQTVPGEAKLHRLALQAALLMILTCDMLTSNCAWKCWLTWDSRKDWNIRPRIILNNTRKHNKKMNVSKLLCRENWNCQTIISQDPKLTTNITSNKPFVRLKLQNWRNLLTKETRKLSYSLCKISKMYQLQRINIKVLWVAGFAFLHFLFQYWRILITMQTPAAPTNMQTWQKF